MKGNLNDKRIEILEIQRVLEDVGRVLREMHAKGFVHFDISPGRRDKRIFCIRRRRAGARRSSIWIWRFRRGRGSPRGRRGRRPRFWRNPRGPRIRLRFCSSWRRLRGWRSRPTTKSSRKRRKKNEKKVRKKNRPWSAALSSIRWSPFSKPIWRISAKRITRISRWTNLARFRLIRIKRGKSTNYRILGFVWISTDRSRCNLGAIRIWRRKFACEVRIAHRYAEAFFKGELRYITA